MTQQQIADKGKEAMRKQVDCGFNGESTATSGAFSEVEFASRIAAAERRNHSSSDYHHLGEYPDGHKWQHNPYSVGAYTT